MKVGKRILKQKFKIIIMTQLTIQQKIERIQKMHEAYALGYFTDSLGGKWSTKKVIFMCNVYSLIYDSSLMYDVPEIFLFKPTRLFADNVWFPALVYNARKELLYNLLNHLKKQL